ncbi:hypothetical protein ACLKA6_010612 [Drosophila palustris]
MFAWSVCVLAYLKSHGPSWPRLRLQFECICFNKEQEQRPRSSWKVKAAECQQEAGYTHTHQSDWEQRERFACLAMQTTTLTA